MDERAAAEVGIRALVWISEREELAGGFLGASGAAAEDLRARASDPEFLGFVLDFLLQDESALLGFCEDETLPPDTPYRARQMLPGGDIPNWT